MVHGWVIIDKPEGVSSARVVHSLKRLFNIKKAGHGGTLDPQASGVLPIALGEATKTLSYVLGGDKAYEFEVKWGEARSTEDREGEVTAISSHRPTVEEIRGVLSFFHGEIDQIPPAYSALKIQGKRAYALARAGKSFELSPRRIRIESLELVSAASDTAVFRVACGTGTYVRSLARDLALRLGTYGYVTRLRRTQAGPFNEKNAILLDSLHNIGHNTELLPSVLPLQDALVDILALEVGHQEATRLQHGQSIPTAVLAEGKALILCEGVPLALAQVSGGGIVPLRVFNIGKE